jgi:hypothetical protein
VGGEDLDGPGTGGAGLNIHRYQSFNVRSLTTKDTKAAKEDRSLTAKDAEAAEDEKRLTAKDAKNQIRTKIEEREDNAKTIPILPSV